MNLFIQLRKTKAYRDQYFQIKIQFEVIDVSDLILLAATASLAPRYFHSKPQLFTLSSFLARARIRARLD